MGQLVDLVGTRKYLIDTELSLSISLYFKVTWNLETWRFIEETRFVAYFPRESFSERTRIDFDLNVCANESSQVELSLINQPSAVSRDRGRSGHLQPDFIDDPADDETSLEHAPRPRERTSLRGKIRDSSFDEKIEISDIKYPQRTIHFSFPHQDRRSSTPLDPIKPK